VCHDEEHLIFGKKRKDIGIVAGVCRNKHLFTCNLDKNFLRNFDSKTHIAYGNLATNFWWN